MNKILTFLILAFSFPAIAGAGVGAMVRFANAEVSVLSEAQAQNLFQEMKANPDIPFDFVLAGCAERAYEMSRLMLLKGVTPLKAFAYPEKGLLKVPHPTRKISYGWVEHVAPVVMVQKGGQLHPYVIDPSIQQSAVPVEVWMNSMDDEYFKNNVKVRYGTANTLLRSGYQIEFNESNTRSNNESLARFKYLSQVPDGEAIWMEEQEHALMKMESSGY